MSLRQFTYPFAKEKGLIIMPGEPLTVGVRTGADVMSLIEARRALGEPHAIKPLETAEFDLILTNAFSRGSMGDTDVEAAMARSDGLESLIDDIPEAADLLGGSDDAPIIKLINGLIHEAVKRRASDIHIDPFENHISIRYRIDGDLVEVLTPPRKLAAPVVSRIKVMARLDIAEKRLPQDGRISLQAAGRSIDVRVAVLPTRFGERVALRLLDTKTALLTLEQLGMDAETYARFDEILHQPNGVVLVTGPVGSGKTTTLYSSISRLNTGQVNIMTLEDPIEYGLPGISQTQMDHRIGLTFARALRNILRQDFNIVMVGEIRDLETAEAAFEFASTGRLAFSTLHTNSAAGAITRLRDMGVEPYLMASTLRAVMAQRLVRKLCDGCKRSHPITETEARLLGFEGSPDIRIYEPDGCLACGNTGFLGRLAVYELLTVNNQIRALLHENAPEEEIDEAAFAHADRLLDNSRRHILSGQTTLNEVLRVCRKQDNQTTEASHG